MLSAKEFYNKYLGKRIDVDGAAGVQCVDLFKEVCYLAGKKPFALGGSGYADEIVHRFDPLGLGAYFEKVSLKNVQYGDWLVWDKGSRDCPKSHVAMFVGWDGDKVKSFGQNQGGNREARVISLSTDGIIGVLRLKEWKVKEDEHAQDIARNASEYGMYVPTEISQGKKFWISRYATFYGGASLGVKIPERILKSTNSYTAGKTITNTYNGQEYKFVLAKEIESYVRVDEIMVK